MEGQSQGKSGTILRPITRPADCGLWRLGKIGRLCGLWRLGKIGRLGNIGKLGKMGRLYGLWQLGNIGKLGRIGRLCRLWQLGKLGELAETHKSHKLPKLPNRHKPQGFPILTLANGAWTPAVRVTREPLYSCNLWVSWIRYPMGAYLRPADCGLYDSANAGKR